MNAILKMRPADPDDEPFLRKLREEIDSERLFLQSWPEKDKKIVTQILNMQFHAHTTHHKNVDSDKKDVIIELDGVPVGRFIVVQDAREICLADIEIAKAYRGMSIGVAVIEGIKGESIQSKRPIRLHVDRNNTALQFYRKQGFCVIETTELNCLMEWNPPTMPGTPMYFTGR